MPKLDQLAVELSDFDIIALSETFLDDSINDDDLHLPGFYNPFRRDRNRHGGGVCIYVKTTLYVERCLELEHSSMECIWLKNQITK